MSFNGLLTLITFNAYAVSAVFSSQESSWKLPPQKSFGVPGINASYDYVVIGGGTAGLTIASRLAEDPALRIAVVEEGGFYELDNGNLSTVPANCTAFAGMNPNDTNPLVDWGFITVPQVVCLFQRYWTILADSCPGSERRQKTIPLCARQNSWWFIRS